MFRGYNPNNIPNFYRDTLCPLLTAAATVELVEWCMARSLLADNRHCIPCNRRMRLIKRTAKLDKVVW